MGGFSDLKFVFLAVDDDGADLLVHEDEDGDQESGNRAGQIPPPGVLTKRHHQPAPIRACGLITHTILNMMNTGESR